MTEVKYNERKQVRYSSLYLSDADAEMFEMIQEYLGCSKSEALRTCIRIAVTHLPIKKQG